MRTSRISRDTSKIVATLSARPKPRPLRQTRASTNASTRDSALTIDEAADVAEATSRESEDVESDNQSSESALTTRIKHETKEVSIAAIASPGKGAIKPKKARRAPAKKVVGSNGKVKIEPPSNWEEVYTLTREMRNENVAPVDTMGCESLADGIDTPRNQRFQTLIALMLSSQTKDTVTSVAIKGMQDNMPGVLCNFSLTAQGLNLESVLALEPAALNAFINKVGFHNLKTKYIKQSAEILRDKWNSDIPDSIQGLTSLPGVGPKMAYLCMSAAWGRDEGIGVDVHVHRITNLWGWHKTKQPEETRAALEQWLPQDKWHDINNLLVGFGQTICLPVGRRCADCKLGARGLCPSAVIGKAVRIKKEEAVLKIKTTDSDDIVKEEVFEAKVPDMEDFGKAQRKSSRIK
ncbi:DNA repair protein-like protein Ntg1 [Polyplosphaeria fusca]|uniref:Endonuclease III homolog n=1 Tax=Polyplosphaeria fusca TaxID=682080 RepID=A0A9P4R8V9_9PLEO|nr:DNA repair protein-like protein Ntg1 [Polyplosphaeria fusca]